MTRSLPAARRHVLRATVLALAWLGAGACSPPASETDGGPPAAGAPERSGPLCQGCNVVVVSIDTLRADRLGVYGYGRDTSPGIDSFAGTGVLFENAYTQSHHTKVSHATLFTSTYPAVHGVGGDCAFDEAGERHCTPTRETRLPERLDTLAEAFRARGHRTAAFVSNPGWLGPEAGFAQGFDDYFAAWRGGDAITEHAVDWLEGESSQPFFLFLHYFDVHSDRQGPYSTGTDFDWRFTEPRPEFSDCLDGRCGSRWLAAIDDLGRTLPPADLEYVGALYDGGVAFADHQVDAVLGELRRLGLDDRTVVVITSDHGEELQEHGGFLHQTLYREVAHVPLVIRVPGAAGGRRVEAPVGLVDVMPTLLDLVGLPRTEGQGRSFAGLLAGRPERGAPVFSTGHRTGADDLFLRHEGWTFRSFEGRTELYDGATDPGETRDLSSSRPEIVRRYARLATNFRRAQAEVRELLLGGGDGATAPDAMSEEDRERLRSLGYLD